MNNDEMNSDSIIEITDDASEKVCEDYDLRIDSIWERVNPEVGKSLVSQIPHATRGVTDIYRQYTDFMKKEIDSLDGSLRDCTSAETLIIKDCSTLISRSDISVEDAKYFIDKAVESAKRIEMMDREHQQSLDSYRKYAAFGLFLGGAVIAGFFLGGLSFHTSVYKLK